MVEYQTAVLRGDVAAAEELLPTIPKEQLNKVARFLEGRGMLPKNHFFFGKSLTVTPRHERTRDSDNYRP